jgi:hypothetical protein
MASEAPFNAALPSAVDPDQKLTDPAGDPELLLTVAVKVTAVPKTEWEALAVNAVVVAAGDAGLTTSLILDEVDAP